MAEINRRDEIELETIVALTLPSRGDEDNIMAVLLRYLPYAPDEELHDALCFGIYECAKRKPFVDAPLFEQLLSDPVEVRRALAACILGRLGTPAQRQEVKRLLKDASPLVRLRAAQGLLGGQDAAGVPTLIELLEQEEIAIIWQAEELLHWAAHGSAPAAMTGFGTARERYDCIQAWKQWWQDRKETIAWERIRWLWISPGLFLATSDDPKDAADVQGRLEPNGVPRQPLGRVRLYGCDGYRKWELPLKDAQGSACLLENGRLLVARYGKGADYQGVSERTLKGDALWTAVFEDEQDFHVGGCNRLPTGETYVHNGSLMFKRIPAGRTRPDWSCLLIDNAGPKREPYCFMRPFGVTRTGRVLSTWEDLNPPDSALKKSSQPKERPNRPIFIVEKNLQTRKMDRQLQIPGVRRQNGAIFFDDNRLQPQPLITGGYLCVLSIENRCMAVEIDEDGKVVWKYQGIQIETRERDRPINGWISQAIRLGDGNTLLAGTGSEIAPNGGIMAWRAGGMGKLSLCLGLVRLCCDFSLEDDR